MSRKKYDHGVIHFIYFIDAKSYILKEMRKQIHSGVRHVTAIKKKDCHEI